MTNKNIGFPEELPDMSKGAPLFLFTLTKIIFLFKPLDSK